MRAPSAQDAQAHLPEWAVLQDGGGVLDHDGRARTLAGARRPVTGREVPRAVCRGGRGWRISSTRGPGVGWSFIIIILNYYYYFSFLFLFSPFNVW